MQGASGPCIRSRVPPSVRLGFHWCGQTNTDIGDIPNIYWIGVNDDHPKSHYLIGFVATHLDTTVSKAIADYEAVMRTIGFQSQVTDTVTPTVNIVTFSNGTETLEARITKRRGNVIVDLQSL